MTVAEGHGKGRASEHSGDRTWLEGRRWYCGLGSLGRACGDILVVGLNVSQYFAEGEVVESWWHTGHWSLAGMGDFYGSIQCGNLIVCGIERSERWVGGGRRKVICWPRREAGGFQSILTRRSDRYEMALVGNCQNPPIRGVAAFAFGYLRHFSSEGLVVVVMMLELDFLYHGQYQ